MPNIELLSQHLKRHAVVTTLAVLAIALFSVGAAVVVGLAVLAAVVGPALQRKFAPLTVIENAVEHHRADTVRVVQQVSLVMADEILLKRAVEREAFQVRRWEERAKVAMLAGNDDEARCCIERKQHHEAERARYLAELDKQKATVSKLRPQVDAMRRETKAARAEADTLAVRRRRADARRTVVMTASGLKTRSGREAFERVSEDVARAEAEAEALETLVGVDSRDEHAEEWERAERAEAVDADLETLRLRFRKALPGRSG